ncbi:MAG: class I SAM-dependent methyltransferase [Rickettsiales bacterium]|nr:class I SAM-dependent methyltransferase [Rickettsiales bacterium]
MEEYTSYYQNTQSILERDTDLGIDGLNKLLGCITQSNVLEVGCGTGYLAKALSKSNTVTATDILISNEIREDNPEITFVSCPAEHLPFEDKAFETTVCTHVLEHVLDFEQCVRELRRVTKKELHIIVPLQRPAKYTPDLHVSFFPYPESFLLRIKPRGVHHFQILDGDLYYVEKCDN